MQILVKNLVVNYIKKGQGTPLILLHGWGASLESFNLIIDKLAEAYEVYALDFPGFGKTQSPDEVWDVGKYAEFVDAFLEKLKIPKATFLGHSFGGRVLIKLLVKKPEIFEKLILTGAAGIKTKDHLRKATFKIVAKIGKTIFRLPGLNIFYKSLQKKLYKMAQVEDYLEAGNLKKTFIQVTKEDLTPFLAKIKIPTLLIWGENDQDAPVQDGELMQHLIPDSKLKIIKNAGHFAFIDKPEEFLEILNQEVICPIA